MKKIIGWVLLCAMFILLLAVIYWVGGIVPFLCFAGSFVFVVIVLIAVILISIDD